MRHSEETTSTTDSSRSSQLNLAADDFIGSPFYVAFARSMKRRGRRPEEACETTDAVERRLLAEYGAMFIAAECVNLPERCVFRSEAEVAEFQAATETGAAFIGGARVELQRAALASLLAARAEAQEGCELDITPRGGAEAAQRNYADTVRLWDSRVSPALDHWLAQDTLGADEAERLRSLALKEQIAAVLEQEARGNFFSKDFSRTILSSVAAPGASQHLALLAFDAAEFRDARVREILARHGWFQTVLDDLPHFTFLGLREKELRARGLKRVTACGQTFWIPNL